VAHIKIDVRFISDTLWKAPSLWWRKTQIKIMPDYITPDKVTSPRRMWTLIRVLENGDKEDSHEERVAVCIGKWEDRTVLGVRRNGWKDGPLGSPQSRGLPTWFIVPRRFQDAIIKTLSTDDQRIVNALLADPK